MSELGALSETMDLLRVEGLGLGLGTLLVSFPFVKVGAFLFFMGEI